MNIWNFKRGFPVKWTGPAMNASQNNVAIETLEIAHEGLSQVPLVGPRRSGDGGIAAAESQIGLWK